jgi:hypothetical protein
MRSQAVDKSYTRRQKSDGRRAGNNGAQLPLDIIVIFSDVCTSVQTSLDCSSKPAFADPPTRNVCCTASYIMFLSKGIQTLSCRSMQPIMGAMHAENRQNDQALLSR